MNTQPYIFKEPNLSRVFQILGDDIAAIITDHSQLSSKEDFISNYLSPNQDFPTFATEIFHNDTFVHYWLVRGSTEENKEKWLESMLFGIGGRFRDDVLTEYASANLSMMSKIGLLDRTEVEPGVYEYSLIKKNPRFIKTFIKLKAPRYSGVIGAITENTFNKYSYFRQYNRCLLEIGSRIYMTNIDPIMGIMATVAGKPIGVDVKPLPSYGEILVDAKSFRN